ncbi:MAG: TIM barrel protein [Oscillospiraceae bacterium]|nr:TIM barrel protein [Oscillospiraceae bacterium]
MFNFSLNLEILFPKDKFYTGFEMAAKAGFKWIEFWDWRDKDLDRIKRMAEEFNLGISAISGDTKYSMVSSVEKEAYFNFLFESIQTARELGCPYLVVHSDALDGWCAKILNEPLSDAEKSSNVYEMLKRASVEAEKSGVCLVYEMLNDTVDHTGYFARSSKNAIDLVRRVNSRYVKTLYDIYHMQIMEGNIIDTICQNPDVIGYIHVADVPGRFEPGTGELNYSNIFLALERLGYDGFIGFECIAQHSPEEAIGAICELCSPFVNCESLSVEKRLRIK